MSQSFDIFLSYTKSIHLSHAREIANQLRQQGYTLWFDEEVLNRKESWVMEDKDLLCDLLREAIDNSKCVVTFEIEQAIIPSNLPNFDRSDGLMTKQIMESPTSSELIAWNWQLFEVRCAKRYIVIGKDRNRFISEDSPPESVSSIYAGLSQMGIFPDSDLSETPASKNPSTSFARLLLWLKGLFYKRETSFNLYEFLPPDDSIQKRLNKKILERLSNFLFDRGYDHYRWKENGAVVLIGDRGSGRSTLLQRLAQRERGYNRDPNRFSRKNHPNVELIQVELPKLSDMESWAKSCINLQRTHRFVFDDFGDNLEAFGIDAEINVIRYLALVNQNRPWPVLVMTPQQAERLVDKFDSLFGLLPVTKVFLSKPDLSDLSLFVNEYWEWLGKDRGVTWNTVEWWSGRFAETLSKMPLTVNLNTLSYKDLQGELICEPFKIVQLTEKILEIAGLESEENRIQIQDYHVETAIRKTTGVHPLALVDKQDPAPVVDALEQTLQVENVFAISEIDQLVRSFRAYFTFGGSPLVGNLICIGDSAKRQHLARVCAKTVFGSEEAIIHLNFENIDDQDLGVAEYVHSEAVRWMVRSVSRYSRWVLLFENVSQALPRDQEFLASLWNGEKYYVSPLRYPNIEDCIQIIDTVPNRPGVEPLVCI